MSATRRSAAILVALAAAAGCRRGEPAGPQTEADLDSGAPLFRAPPTVAPPAPLGDAEAALAFEAEARVLLGRERVAVLEANGGWARVRRPGGEVVWVNPRALQVAFGAAPRDRAPTMDAMPGPLGLPAVAPSPGGAPSAASAPAPAAPQRPAGPPSILERVEDERCPRDFPDDLAPIEAAERCAGAAATAPDALEPRLLLAAARLYEGLGAVCRREACEDFAAYAADRRRDFEPVPEGWAYSGSHLRTLIARYPGTREAGEARCRLASRGRDDDGYGAAACRAWRASGAVGRCDVQLPEGCHAAFLTALRCEANAFGSPELAQPPLLLAAGRLFRGVVRVCQTDHERAALNARDRPDLFFYDELSGGWASRDRHLREVVDRWPKAAAADDAAWDLAAEPAPGECEEDFCCGLRVAADGPIAFVAGRPRSPHAPAAVERVNAALGAFQRGGGMPHGAEALACRGVLQGYETAAAKLAPALGAAALEALAPWWDELGDAKRAQRLRAEAGRLREGP